MAKVKRNAPDDITINLNDSEFRYIRAAVADSYLNLRDMPVSIDTINQYKELKETFYNCFLPGTESR